MSNIIEYIRYDIAESASRDFEQSYERAAGPLATSPHCRSFELSRCVEEPNRYILRIEWDSLDGHMQGFRSSTEFREFFSHIRPFVDSIDEMQHYEPTNVVDPAGEADEAVPTLYEWAGGEAAIRAMIDAFYNEVERTDLFDALFPGGVTVEHRQHVTNWWVEVFGGPKTYSDEHGGYDAMLEHHLELNIGPEQRANFVSLMSRAADTADLPSDPEFRSALLAYLEWGTRLAFENSQPGATPFRGATVPRWGWGEAPPFQA